MKKRNTQTKALIWEILSNAKCALCNEDIQNLTENGVDKVTIYRILQSFCDDGTVHKVIDLSGKTYYAKCRKDCCTIAHHDNHAHFKCVRCNTIICLNQEFVPQLPDNFNYITMNCFIEGVCSSCKTL